MTANAITSGGLVLVNCSRGHLILTFGRFMIKQGWSGARFDLPVSSKSILESWLRPND
ncbi:hypothetical protein CEB3_c40100 [Peptococcaceae bacterium CEB3]|nr:hypothetical protein CEB3_c40100 [Peptococcaceae bacterium CEB3]